MTMIETYYALNTALSGAMKSHSVACPLYKYGVTPSMINNNQANKKESYPYLQTSYSVDRSVSRTSQSSGTVTDFDYQLSFFTSPSSEFSSDKILMDTWEKIKNCVSDVRLAIFSKIADLLNHQEVDGFDQSSGMIVASKFLICKMRAVCTYAIDVPGSAVATKYIDSIGIKRKRQ